MKNFNIAYSHVSHESLWKMEVLLNLSNNLSQ